MWSELFCRARDNLLSLHFASANVLGHYSRRERVVTGISYSYGDNVKLKPTTLHLVQVSLRRNLTKKPPIVGALPPLWSSTPRGDKNSRAVFDFWRFVSRLNCVKRI